MYVDYIPKNRCEAVMTIMMAMVIIQSLPRNIMVQELRHAFYNCFLLYFVCDMNNTGSEWQARPGLSRSVVESVSKG